MKTAVQASTPADLLPGVGGLELIGKGRDLHKEVSEALRLNVRPHRPVQRCPPQIAPCRGRCEERSSHVTSLRRRNRRGTEVFDPRGPPVGGTYNREGCSRLSDKLRFASVDFPAATLTVQVGKV